MKTDTLMNSVEMIVLRECPSYRGFDFRTAEQTSDNSFRLLFYMHNGPLAPLDMMFQESCDLKCLSRMSNREQAEFLLAATRQAVDGMKALIDKAHDHPEEFRPTAVSVQ